MFGNMPFNGARMVTGTSSAAGPFVAIFCVAETNFSAFSEEGLSGTITGVAFPANSWIFGRINSFTLTSGTVRAYRKG